MLTSSGSGLGAGVSARMLAVCFTSPNRLVPRMGFIRSQIRAVSVAIGADLEEVVVQAPVVGHELDPALGLVLAVAGVDVNGQDVRERRVGPAAFAEAGMAAQHHQARPLAHGLGQQPLLLGGQVVGREVAEDDRRCSGPA